jgi:ketosteroid isomerase-like protein
LSGVYEFDPMASDKLYTVVTSAATNLPYARQQRFFDDLTVRLSSPDIIAIERRGSRVHIASSRAPRVMIFADNRERTERGEEGRILRTRARFETDQLVITTGGTGVDPFYVSFQTLDGGRRLRVMRRIYSEQLNQPLIVQSLYNKVSDNARWDIYGEQQVEPATAPPISVAASSAPSVAPPTAVVKAEADQAALLRSHLNEWIAATNNNSIAKQMTFYQPRLDAYYLTRNVPRETVRREKERVFAGASSIDIRAAEPEIIFLDGGSMAIMRFRKQYGVENGGRTRSGEVMQEFRWRQTNDGWKISSERDVRVIR